MKNNRIDQPINVPPKIIDQTNIDPTSALKKSREITLQPLKNDLLKIFSNFVPNTSIREIGLGLWERRGSKFLSMIFSFPTQIATAATIGLPSGGTSIYWMGLIAINEAEIFVIELFLWEYPKNPIIMDAIKKGTTPEKITSNVLSRVVKRYPLSSITINYNENNSSLSFGGGLNLAVFFPDFDSNKNSLNALQIAEFSGIPKKQKKEEIPSQTIPSQTIEISEFNIAIEYVTIQNITNRAIFLKDWKMRNEKADHTYNFPDITIEPKEKITIFSGVSGVNTKTELYWTEKDIWNKNADKIFLYDPKWNFIDSSSSKNNLV